MKVDVKGLCITLLIVSIIWLGIGYFFGRTGLSILGILCAAAISGISCLILYLNLKEEIKPKEEETKLNEEIKKED